MIPSFIIVSGALWPVLPPGIYDASIGEIRDRFAINPQRLELFMGLLRAIENLFQAGCPQIFLDGSFVTAKPIPNDYDALWDRRFVDPALVDPVFLDFTNGTVYQKAKYLGEFFPASGIEALTKRSFMNFFQTDRITGATKGIIRLTNYIKGGGAK